MIRVQKSVSTTLVSLCLLGCLAGCLNQNIRPVESFTATPSFGPAPLLVTFDASASDDPDGVIASYRWELEPGATGSGQTTQHTFPSAGTYTSSLTVTDDGGATDTTARTIVVSQGDKLQILDWRLEPYDNTFMPWVVRGHAKNVSGRKLSYAEVHAGFYDANGILLASWLDNVSDLQAGVTWEFHVYCMDTSVADRVDHASVSVGTCF